MNPEVKQKWIGALRTGDYVQGKGYLRKDNKYCCLGVLCDLYVKETGQGSWGKDSSDLKIDGMAFTSTTDKMFKLLPEEVAKWAELDSRDPIIGEQFESLSDLNDLGRSFEQISSFIEGRL